MATSKITLFNNALVELGNERLEDTGENVKAGRELNAVYDQVVQECLCAGSHRSEICDPPIAGVANCNSFSHLVSSLPAPPPHFLLPIGETRQ